MTKKSYKPAPPGYKWIFRPYFVHPKTGNRVYPKKGRVFPLLVKA